MNMYEWDDILIIGDSFASFRARPDHWPMALTLKLTAETYKEHDQKLPRGYGYPGASWWSTRKKLLSEIDIRIPKILIICHTESDRIPSDYDYGLNIGYVADEKLLTIPKDDRGSYDRAVILAADQYYKHLFSSSYHQWAFEQWFTELDTIVSEKNIEKVIHMHSFPAKTPGKPGRSKILPKVFNNGITSAEILFNVVLEKYNFADVMSPTGGFVNHFRLAENISIADALYDTIINFTPEQNGTIQNLNLLQQ